MDFGDLNSWMLVFLRASGLMAVFPIISGKNVPIRIRVMLTVLFSFLIHPSLPAVNLGDVPFLGLMGLFTREILVGLAIGFFSRLLFFGLEIAGVVIAFQMGLQVSNSINPVSETQTQTPGTILHYLGALIFLSLDLHHWTLMGFYRSFELVPFGTAEIPEGLLHHVVSRTGDLFNLALLLAAPTLAVALIITFIFAILGRAVPQMNVFGESFAVRTLAGLGVFGLTISLMARHIITFLNTLPNDLETVIQFLAG